MHLISLSLQNFRNYEEEIFEPVKDNNFLYGGNGEGKTNLLEAVFYMAYARSTRTNKDRELLKKDSDEFVLEARFFRENEEGLHFAEEVQEDVTAADKIASDLKTSSEAAADMKSGANAAEVADLEKAADKTHNRQAAENSSQKGDLLNLKISYNKSEKKIFLNGLPTDKISDIFGCFKAVLFTPEDLSLIKGPPVERRRFIDILISMCDMNYYFALENYKRYLKIKNDVLKQVRDGELNYSAYEIIIDSFDRQLAEAASEIIYKRAEALRGLKERADAAMNILSLKKEDLAFVYNSFIDEEIIDQSLAAKNLPDKELLYKRYRSRREKDIALGYTVAGVHRESIDVLLNDLDSRVYASQGQQRSAVLALKTAEINYIKDKTGIAPVLLLDDVLSELDAERRAVIPEITRGFQSIITGTDLEEEFCKNQRCKIFMIKSGRIKRFSP